MNEALFCSDFAICAKPIVGLSGNWKKFDEKTNRTVTREGNQLFIHRTGGGKGPIMAASATQFFQPNSFTTFTSETDASGETTHLVVNQASGIDKSPRIAN